AEDSVWDVATFKVSTGLAAALVRYGKTTLTGSQRCWPPKPPELGKGVFFVGFPGDGRTLSEVDPVRGTTGTGFLVGSSGCSVFLTPLRNKGLLLLWQLWACGQRASVVQAQRHVHSRRAEGAGDALAPHRQGRPIAEPLMGAIAVVEGHPQAD